MGRSQFETRSGKSIFADGTLRVVNGPDTLGNLHSDGTSTVIWANAEAEHVFWKISSPPR